MPCCAGSGSSDGEDSDVELDAEGSDGVVTAHAKGSKRSRGGSNNEPAAVAAAATGAATGAAGAGGSTSRPAVGNGSDDPQLEAAKAAVLDSLRK